MKVEIIEEKENPLLDRKEMKIKVAYTGATPSRKEIRDKIIAKLKANKDLVVLNSLNSKFGTREATGNVRIYKTKKRAHEIELKHVLKKNFPELFEAKKAEKAEVKEKEAVEIEKPERVEKVKEEAMKKEGLEKVEKKVVEKKQPAEKEELKSDVKKEEEIKEK